MNEKELEEIVGRYLKGQASQKEIDLLDHFFESYRKRAKENIGQDAESSSTKLELFHRIRSQIDIKEKLAAERGGSSIYGRLVAAVVIIAILAFAGFWAYQTEAPGNTVALIQKTTSKGQRSTLTLADGTVVRLNAESTISFPEAFSSNKREVTLHGEAFFEVTKDPSRPFVIKTDEVTTTVLGTSFNIKAFSEDDIAVTVATGKVSVVAKRNGDLENEVVLVPSEQAVFNKSNSTLGKKTVQLDNYLAWKDGRIVFDNVPLSEVANILERWYNVDLVIENETLSHCLIWTEYKNESLINILESLKFIMGIEYRFEKDQQIILTGKDCNK